MLKKILGSLGIAFMGIFCVVSAVNVFVPRDTSSDEDYQVNNASYNTQISGSHSYIDVIALVNNYLWFAVGFVCFLFMIWNGYQLIIARGSADQSKKAINAIIGWGVGIAVCLLAYIIVKLTVNLF